MSSILDFDGDLVQHLIQVTCFGRCRQKIIPPLNPNLSAKNKIGLYASLQDMDDDSPQNPVPCSSKPVIFNVGPREF